MDKTQDHQLPQNAGSNWETQEEGLIWYEHMQEDHRKVCVHIFKYQQAAEFLKEMHPFGRGAHTNLINREELLWKVRSIIMNLAS